MQSVEQNHFKTDLKVHNVLIHCVSQIMYYLWSELRVMYYLWSELRVSFYFCGPIYIVKLKPFEYASHSRETMFHYSFHNCTLYDSCLENLLAYPNSNHYRSIGVVFDIACWHYYRWQYKHQKMLVVIGTDCIGSFKSNYHAIMTMTPLT